MWAPCILYFKGLGMQNFIMRVCQKSHDKVTNQVYVWFELLWIRRYMIYILELYKLLKTDRRKNIRNQLVFQKKKKFNFINTFITHYEPKV